MGVMVLFEMVRNEFDSRGVLFQLGKDPAGNDGRKRFVAARRDPIDAHPMARRALSNWSELCQQLVGAFRETQARVI